MATVINQLINGMRPETILKSSSAAVTSATNQTSVILEARDGQFGILEGKSKWTGAGGAGSITLTLPTGWVIDTTYLTGGTGATNQTASLLSNDCMWFDQGNGWLQVWAVYATTTTITFAMGTQVLDGSQFANGDALNFRIMVPIVGWTA